MKTASTTAPTEGKVTTVNPDEYPPLLFSDGVHGLIVNATISKLQLYQIVGTSDGTEQRKLMQTLAIPTVVLADFCTKYLAILEANSEKMSRALVEQQGRVSTSTTDAHALGAHTGKRNQLRS